MPTILITGAERGLGLGLAEAFLSRGWSVTATVRPGASREALNAIGTTDPSRLSIDEIDVADGAALGPFLAGLGDRRFDVVFSNAGIFGPLHQDVRQAEDAEFAAIMLTNCFGPVRLATHLLDRLAPGGTLAFMSSHRASIALNDGAGLDLYRASKVALNMLAKNLWVTGQGRGLTVLLVHPGWAATAMGTLDGTVAAEIGVAESVGGVAAVVERHHGSGAVLYRDWQDRALPW